ncbi:MAG TPA: hypothetical protein PK636_00120 [bacterium]|nr:hypothetical protein [bacterium]HPJ71071.1 hypothetical protein [bacterium]HPQ65851.1 hypothetical protein [bacterium]
MKNTMISILAGAAVLTGCSRSYLPTRYYRIDTVPVVARTTEPLGLSIKIEEIWAPAFYGVDMVYQDNAFEVGQYQYSQWTEPPNLLLYRAVFNSITASGLFSRVDGPLDTARTDLLLRGELFRFDQVLDGEGTSAQCRFSLILIDLATDLPVWSFTADKLGRQKEEGAFAETMSGLVAEAMAAMVESLEQSPRLRELARAGRKGAGEAGGEGAPGS